MNLVTHYGFNDRANLNMVRQFETIEQIKEFLKLKYSGGCCFGGNELRSRGQYREAAINYDFRPWLKKYLVEYNHGTLQAAWAPTKGELRKSMGLSRKDGVLLYPEA